MGTPFTTLYDGVIRNMKSYDFINMTQEECYSVLSEYVRPAVTDFRGCHQDLTKRSETSFDLNLTDTEIEILINYMTIEWIDANHLRVPTMLKYTLSSKDFNAFSPANQLKEMIELREMYRKDNETKFVRYRYCKYDEDTHEGT